MKRACLKQTILIHTFLRVDGLIQNGETNKDFKSLKTQDEIYDLLQSFIMNATIKVSFLYNNSNFYVYGYFRKSTLNDYER